MEASLLTIVGLTIQIDGHRLLDELSIVVEPGWGHALVGANGSGKTTLARLRIGTEGYCAASGNVADARGHVDCRRSAAAIPFNWKR